MGCKSKKASNTDKPSGINVEGMGGTGEEMKQHTGGKQAKKAEDLIADNLSKKENYIGS
ncbi:MAG TPA: hypothetical protein GXX46_06445 [Peptococcaceae bacterium]|nr:hypothetical protein [Peptococcaceae bacterium]